MLHKFYKTFFFTTLAVTTLIAAQIILGNTSHTRTLAEMVFNTNGDISTAVVAFFPICTTVLCILFALIISISLHFIQKKKSSTHTPKKTNFFFYYFICLVTVSLLVFFFCWWQFNIFDRCIYVTDVIVFPLLYGACIVEALVLAALLVSFFTLWKTNKTVAFIIGAVILFIIPVNLISGVALKDVSGYCRHYDYTNNKYDSQNYTIEEEYDEGDYENVIEVVDDYLSFLWNEEDNIDATFEHLFNDELNYWNSDYPQSFLFVLSDFVYMLNADDEEWNSLNTDTDTKGLLRNTIHKIHRYLKDNSSEILNAFYSYEDVIYRYIPRSSFSNTATEALLQQLTAAHGDLYSDDDFSRLRNIYSQMTDISHSYASEYYDDIKQYINQDYLHYFNDKDGDFYQGAAVWAYSFWARRYVEGTDDIAYSILSRINEHYIDSEYHD